MLPRAMCLIVAIDFSQIMSPNRPGEVWRCALEIRRRRNQISRTTLAEIYANIASAGEVSPSVRHACARPYRKKYSVPRQN